MSAAVIWPFVVSGEKAALACQAAAGDDVLAGVAGQQAEIGRRHVGGQFGAGRRADLRFDREFGGQPGPVGAEGNSHHVVFVDPGDLRRPRGVVGQRLGVPAGDA
jgi:hypothetical protein